MSNTEQLARDWATEALQHEERAQNYDDKFLTKEEKAAAKFILERTEPQTMAEVEWDTVKHTLTGAVDIDGDEVAMLHKPSDGIIYAWWPRTQGVITYHPNDLTPNGKRYKLVEEPPKEYLRTVKDYDTAPSATVILGAFDSTAYIKGCGEWYATGANASTTPEELACSARKVLYWPEGE